MLFRQLRGFKNSHFSCKRTHRQFKKERFDSTASRKVQVMGRTRGKKTAAKPIQVETAAAAAPQPEAASVQQYSADELVSKAEDLVESYQFDLALQFCLRALEGEPQHAQALETAATVELELGLVEEAHQVC